MFFKVNKKFNFFIFWFEYFVKLCKLNNVCCIFQQIRIKENCFYLNKIVDNYNFIC